MTKNISTLVIMTLIFIALVFAGLIKLGMWQLDRADEKEQYFSSIMVRTAQPHQPLASVTAQDLSQYPVVVSGTLLHQYTFLLDNITNNGRVGYHVLVPLLIDDYAAKVIVVNLGWVAGNGYRDILPELNTWSGSVEITGNLHQPSDNPYAFEMKAGDKWPRVIAQIELDKITQQLQIPLGDLHLFPAVLRIEPAHQVGYQKQWLWVNMSVEKHLGYAVQWFTLAATLLILTGVFWRRNSQKETA